MLITAGTTVTQT